MKQPGRDLISEAHYEFMRLFKRLKVTGATVDGQILIEPRLIPIIDIEDLFWIPKQELAVKDISVSDQPYFTVPDGKRWRVRHIWRAATTGTTRMYLEDPAALALNLQTAGTAEQIYGTLLVIEAKWKIGLLTGSNGADTARTMHIIYDEADAF